MRPPCGGAARIGDGHHGEWPSLAGRQRNAAGCPVFSAHSIAAIMSSPGKARATELGGKLRVAAVVDATTRVSARHRRILEVMSRVPRPFGLMILENIWLETVQQNLPETVRRRG